VSIPIGRLQVIGLLGRSAVATDNFHIVLLGENSLFATGTWLPDETFVTGACLNFRGLLKLDDDTETGTAAAGLFSPNASGLEPSMVRFHLLACEKLDDGIFGLFEFLGSLPIVPHGTKNSEHGGDGGVIPDLEDEVFCRMNVWLL
jgi:hypothetical protein